MNEKRHGQHDHKEAFALMLYVDTAGRREWLWNSRDGVTPFCIRSPDGLDSRHTNFAGDIYAPNHAPRAGDRIFVDLTRKRALEYRRPFVASHWDVGEYAIRTHPAFEGMTQEQAVEKLADTDVGAHGGGSPDVVTVTEEMAGEFARWGVDRHPDRRPYERGGRFA